MVSLKKQFKFSWAYMVAVLLLASPSIASQSLLTNAVHMHNAPSWLTAGKIDTVVDKIQYRLEWSTRRVNVYWHSDQKKFEALHGLGSTARAFARRKGEDMSVHLGPLVNEKNFEHIFGHEIVHIIFFQKYRGAIPKWLEEGFANHLTNKKKVNYKWLSKQKLPADIRTLSHPYKGSKYSIALHYEASQALVEMLEKNCDLDNLLRLSVQRKMKNYIESYCEIRDINSAINLWIQKQSLPPKKS